MVNNDARFDLASVPEDLREKALKRFQMIRPFIEDAMPLPQVSQSSKIPLRTLRRWIKLFREMGFAGLIPQQRKSYESSVPAEMKHLIEGLALQSSKRTVTSIKREVDLVCQELGWPIISYHSMRRIVLGLNKGLVTLAHDGSKEYGEKFDLVFRREANRPNQIWQADHTLLDCWILDEDNKAARPWLSIILDDFSRSICAYFLSFGAPDTMRTALMLRQGIWRKSDHRWRVQGIPERFYTDHGSDFTSAHMEQVAADIKMSLVFSVQGKPRGRGKMERFFGTVNELFLCHVPGNMLTSMNSFEEATLTLSELKARFHEWLLADYQFREHSETKMTPLRKWEDSGILPRIPDSLEHLDLLLLTVAKPRQIQPDGIHFQNLRYVSPVLAPYVRESVIIRYDPRDMAEIRVFYKNRFLCRAICGALETQTVSLKEIVQARKQQKRHLNKELSTRRKAVECYIQSHAPRKDPALSSAKKNQPCTQKLKLYETD